jgi:hypothetical protein
MKVRSNTSIKMLNKTFYMSNTVKIMEVIDVNLTIYKTNPPILNIRAEGIVPTGGYKNGRLVPYVYVQFPPDGIWDFDFVADSPDGPTTDVLSPINAEYMWPDYPAKLIGVRIHSANNKIEKKTSDHKEKTLKSSLIAQ